MFDINQIIKDQSKVLSFNFITLSSFYNLKINMDLNKPLLEIKLLEGIVVNRPSKKIKSPYLADVQLT